MTVLTVRDFGDGCDIEQGKSELFIDKRTQMHRYDYMRDSAWERGEIRVSDVGLC